jgi:Group II intron, maturase-specific domain
MIDAASRKAAEEGQRVLVVAGGHTALADPRASRRGGPDRIRFMSMRARLAAPVEQLVWKINLFTRGWADYFR